MKIEDNKDARRGRGMISLPMHVSDYIEELIQPFKYERLTDASKSKIRVLVGNYLGCLQGGYLLSEGEFFVDVNHYEEICYLRNRILALRGNKDSEDDPISEKKIQEFSSRLNKLSKNAEKMDKDKRITIQIKDAYTLGESYENRRQQRICYL